MAQVPGLIFKHMVNKEIEECSDFITIPRFLVNKFRLSGNELIITSLIYGYCKHGQGEFFGTCDYIAQWTAMSREAVLRALHRLVKRGILTSRSDVRRGKKAVIYSVNMDGSKCDKSSHLNDAVNVIDDVSKCDVSKSPNVMFGFSNVMSNHTDNIEDNIGDNIDDNIEWAQQKDFAADTHENGEDFERDYEEAEVVETSLFPIGAEKEKSCAKKEKERVKSEVKSEVKSGKVTLFCNSSVYKLVKDDDYSAFEALFKGPEYEDIDLVYYFHAVCDWSSSANKKRTERGWIATVRNFIRGDMERGKLHKKPEKQLICGFTEDEVRDMLKGNKFKI